MLILNVKTENAVSSTQAHTKLRRGKMRCSHVSIEATDVTESHWKLVSENREQEGGYFDVRERNKP